MYGNDGIYLVKCWGNIINVMEQQSGERRGVLMYILFCCGMMAGRAGGVCVWERLV